MKNTNSMMNPGRYLALSGGVGGAKLALGLAEILPANQLAIAVNTADDFQHLGLHISPDVDTLLYTLAGVNNPETGWGRRDETWNFMQSIQELGGETWFQLGDRDLAINVERTCRLRKGITLAEVTTEFAKSMSVAHSIFPMSNDAIQTRVITNQGVMDFQHYFVREQCKPEVQDIEFEGAENAQLNPDIAAWMCDPDLAGVILCPSNPFLSIDPILAVPGMRNALISCDVPVVAVSPLVGGAAIKGPTAKIMKELSMPLSSVSVAEYYADFLDGFILDCQDSECLNAVEKLDIQVTTTDTIMNTLTDKTRVAESCLMLLDKIGK